MHELAVTQSILDIAVQHAKQANADRVTVINLVIGRLASIVDDSVQFYWDILSKDSVCQGATLHFDRRPAKMYCLDCSQAYEMDAELSPCPNCQGMHLKVIAGEEFFLESIEIEKATE